MDTKKSVLIMYYFFYYFDVQEKILDFLPKFKRNFDIKTVLKFLKPYNIRICVILLLPIYRKAFIFKKFLMLCKVSLVGGHALTLYINTMKFSFELFLNHKIYTYTMTVI